MTSRPELQGLTPAKLAEIRRRIETKDNDVYWAEEDRAALAAEVERLSGEVERLTELAENHRRDAESSEPEISRLKAERDTALEREQRALNQMEIEAERAGDALNDKEAAESSVSRLTERAEMVLAEAKRGLQMVHDALADPTRPRQSVGEVAAHWLARINSDLGEANGR